MKYYCDTNFVIRHLLGNNQEMLLKTAKVFAQVKTGEIFLILEQTVFTEIVFVLSSFYKVPKNKISEILSELLTYKGIMCENKGSLLLALDLYHKQNLHIVDCLLIAKAETAGLEILSFDQKLMTVRNRKDRL